MAETRQDITERVRRARELAGRTQAEAALVLGITRPSYTQKENGVYEFSALDICKLADFFDVPAMWLLKREDEPANSLALDNELVVILSHLSRKGQRALVSLLTELAHENR